LTLDLDFNNILNFSYRNVMEINGS